MFKLLSFIFKILTFFKFVFVALMQFFKREFEEQTWYIFRA